MGMFQNKKNKNIAIGVVLLLVLGFIAYANLGFNLNNIDYADIDYDDARPDKFYEPIFGSLSCKATNIYGADESPYNMQVIHDDGGWLGFAFDYASVTISSGDVDARYRITDWACNDGAIKKISVNGGNFQTYNDELRFLTTNSAQSIELRCQKSTSYSTSDYTFASNPNIIKSEKIKMLWFDSQGYGQGTGFVAGSQGCLLNGADANKIKNLQPQGVQLATRVDQMNPITNIIVAWSEQPTDLAGINYNGILATCKSQPTGIIRAIVRVETNGGEAYAVEKAYGSVGRVGRILAEGDDVCCNNGDTVGDQVCENYKLVAKPVTCDYGSCNKYNFVETSEAIQVGSSFVRRDQSCDNDGCIQRTDRTIQCTPDYCGRMSTSGNEYICDENVGCVKISVPDICPAGDCCLSPAYNSQECLGDNKVCDMTVYGESYRGKCVDEGQEEICDNGIDDNNNGLIDEGCDDETCVVDGIAYLNAQDCCEARDNTWVTTQTEDCSSIWCKIGLTEPEVVTESYCKEQDNTWLYVGIALIVVSMLAFAFSSKKQKKAMGRWVSKNKGTIFLVIALIILGAILINFLYVYRFWIGLTTLILSIGFIISKVYM